MSRLSLTTPRAIVVAALMLAATIFFTTTGKAEVVLGIGNVITTGGAALFVYFLWRSQRRIEWFTGAMEAHSDQMRKFEAKKLNIKMIWWDRTIAPIPFTGKHGEEVNFQEIYISLPPELRREQASALWKRFSGDR